MTLAFRTFVNETCPKCHEIVRIVGTTALKGRLVEHEYTINRIDIGQAMASANTVSIDEVILQDRAVAMPCRGSGGRSVEYLARAHTAKLERQLRREADVRHDALVAIDALAEGREVFKFAKLLDIAIKMHERKFGPGQRGKTVVRTEQLRHRERRGSVNSFYRMDVYCRFCGGLVVPALNTASNPEAMPRVKSHTMRCALECLAGMREMRGSDHKGLIDEDRAFA